MKLTLAKVPTMTCLVLSALILTGCAEDNKRKARSFSQSSAEAVVVDSAVNAINGIFDEVSGLRATEAGCGADASQTCGAIRANVVERRYSCQNGSTTLGGTSVLSFTNGTCSLSTGQSVFVTESTTVAEDGSAVTTNTTTHQDYTGSNYPGGASLIATSSTGGNTTFQFSVQGLRRLIVEDEALTGDFSLRTQIDPVISGGLGRGARRVQNGMIHVADNRNRFTADVLFSDVRWSGGCCFPVSGTLQLTFNGTQTGSRTVTMTGCGTFRVTNGSSTTQGEFLRCGL